MKIRTGFVTNSSSYSSAEIKIENPVLLEILKKYKDLAVFNNIYVAIIIKDKHILIERDETADDVEKCPETLSDVVDCLLSAIKYIEENHWDYIYYDYGDYQEEERVSQKKKIKKMISEIKERKKEINGSYKYVKWLYDDWSYGEFDNNGGSLLLYKKAKDDWGINKYIATEWNGAYYGKVNRNDELILKRKKENGLKYWEDIDD